jgi:hypothetical protein
MASTRAAIALCSCLFLSAASIAQAAPRAPGAISKRQQRRLAYRQARAEFRSLLVNNKPLRSDHRERVADHIVGQGMAATFGGGIGGGVMGGVIGGGLAFLDLLFGGRGEVFGQMVTSMAAIGAGGGALITAVMTPSALKHARTETAKQALKEGTLERDVAARWLKAGLIDSTRDRRSSSSKED